jgi:hypothetical protein
MNLDDAQKQKVVAWVNEGLKLAEIQKRMVTELGLNFTYMEVRLLVDDLKLVPKDPEPAKPADLPAAKPAPDSPQPAASRDATPAPEPLTSGPGKLSLTVDQITRPGALVSGSVTFRDGKKAGWYLDQTGRLGLIPKDHGYKPAAADVQEFQKALESELSRLGM